jgi:hypothetical protein
MSGQNGASADRHARHSAQRLLTAVDHLDGLKQKHRAEIADARQRLRDAVRDLPDIEDEDDRLRVVLSIYERAQGHRQALAYSVGLSTRAVCLLLRADAERDAATGRQPLGAAR